MICKARTATSLRPATVGPPPSGLFNRQPLHRSTLQRPHIPYQYITPHTKHRESKTELENTPPPTGTKYPTFPHDITDPGSSLFELILPLKRVFVEIYQSLMREHGHKTLHHRAIDIESREPGEIAFDGSSATPYSGSEFPQPLSVDAHTGLEGRQKAHCAAHAAHAAHAALTFGSASTLGFDAVAPAESQDTLLPLRVCVLRHPRSLEASTDGLSQGPVDQQWLTCRGK